MNNEEKLFIKKLKTGFKLMSNETKKVFSKKTMSKQKVLRQKQHIEEFYSR